MKLVFIEWEDHCGYAASGWSEAENLENKPCIIHSVGYVVKEDDKYITITGCYDTGSQGMKNVSVIIKSCITKRKNIKL